MFRWTSTTVIPNLNGNNNLTLRKHSGRHVTNDRLVLPFYRPRAVSWAPSSRIRIVFNPQLFLSGYGFRPHVSDESGIRISNIWIRSPEWKFLNTSSIPALYPEYCIQDGNLAHNLAHALLPIFLGVLSTRVNPDTCRMIRVDGQIRFASGYVRTWKFLNPQRKKLRIQKYPDKCGRALFSWKSLGETLRDQTSNGCSRQLVQTQIDILLVLFSDGVQL